MASIHSLPLLNFWWGILAHKNSQKFCMIVSVEFEHLNCSCRYFTIRIVDQVFVFRRCTITNYAFYRPFSSCVKFIISHERLGFAWCCLLQSFSNATRNTFTTSNYQTQIATRTKNYSITQKRFSAHFFGLARKKRNKNFIGT